MEKPAVLVQEVGVEKDCRISEDSSISSQHSRSSLEKPRSTRHSYEAPPTSPSSISNKYKPSTNPSNNPSGVSVPAEYSRSTTYDPDAPPPYAEKQYETAKSAEEERRMRKRDYAIEMSRIMGRQLVKGLTGKGHAAGGS